MSKVQGRCDKRFQHVANLLQSSLDSDAELGASITVNLDGIDVVDIWGGYSEPSRTKAWEPDTIVNVYSCTKIVSSIAVLLLVSRGLIDVDERVSKYWPEFAANGKQDVLVRHLLSHTSGVSGWEEPCSIHDLYDTPKAAAMLAAQAPWWEPGTKSGYHVASMGTLLGELVRRTSGKPLKQFVADELATPLGADFQIGAAERDWPRVATLVPPPDAGSGDAAFEGSSAIRLKSFTNPMLKAGYSRSSEWKRAEVGAANGHTNSRGLNRVLSVVSLGGNVSGQHFMSQQTLDHIFREQAHGKDLVLGMPVRFGIGFGLSGSKSTQDWLPEGRVCFWSGWGGSVGVMDLDRRLTITYAMNKMKAATMGSQQAHEYVKAVYAALDKAGEAKL